MVFKVRSHRKTIYVIRRGKWSYLISKATLTISARAFFIKPEAQNSSYCAERLFSCAWAWRFAPRCRSLGFDIIPVVFGSLSALKISLFCAASNNRLHRLLIGRRWKQMFPVARRVTRRWWRSSITLHSSRILLRLLLSTCVFLNIWLISLESVLLLKLYCSYTPTTYLSGIH